MKIPKKLRREAHSARECASVIFAPRRVILPCSDIMLRIVILPTAALAANLISRKPKGFHITFRKENITFVHRHSGYRILMPKSGIHPFSDNTRRKQRKICAAFFYTESPLKGALFYCLSVSPLFSSASRLSRRRSIFSWFSMMRSTFL